ncbi:bacteriocin class II family protein [Streptococcus ferus]|uniref:bacteriocin class II family protein n=1 Tax=Streptococcus ferus TaxID=1345 RepID=UPI002354ED44|nr:bacteriocin class II family protein [Streptococcus ferus]
MELNIKNYKSLTNNELSEVVGGDRQAANTFLSAIGGAASGFTYCASSGVWHPYILAGCAGVGAVGSVVFPH